LLVAVVDEGGRRVVRYLADIGTRRVDELTVDAPFKVPAGPSGTPFNVG
jgi:hypothetical protein